MCVNGELIVGTQGRAINWAHPHPRPHLPLNWLQIGGHSLSTSCWVVEHCGDDLVLFRHAAIGKMSILCHQRHHNKTFAHFHQTPLIDAIWADCNWYGL